MTRFAKSTFNGAPNDKLEAVDVYKQTQTPAQKAEGTKESGSRLPGFSEITKPLGDTIDQAIAAGEKALDGSSETNREERIKQAEKDLQRALKGGRAQLEGVGKDAINAMYDEYIGPEYGHVVPDPTTLVGMVRARSKDTEELMEGADPNSAQAIAAFVRDLAGSEVFTAVNLGAEAALVAGTLDKLAEWRVPEMLDAVMDKMDQDAKKRAAAQKAIKFAEAGDIDSVEVLLKHVGVEVLLSRQPDLPRTLLKRYKFKKGTTVAHYPERLTQLVRVMNQLHPTWFWTYRNGEQVWNLGMIASASDDALLLFYSNATYRTPALIAPKYPEKRPQTLLRSMYPYIAINP